MIPRKTRMKAMFACLSGSPPAENGPIRTDYVAYNDVSARGCSSAGRALESHSRGQGFESPQLHRVMVSASSLIIRTSWSVITVRSEERRVGKECRARVEAYDEMRKSK